MKNIEKLSRGKIPTPEAGLEVKKSICTICDSPLCGLDLYVKDGKIIKVEGSKEHPGSIGTLCSKGAANRQYIYSADRLKTPLKRTGPRGSGKFEPISWDEALDTIASKFNEKPKWTGVRSLLLRLHEILQALPETSGSFFRLTKLFDRIEHLPPGYGHGSEAYFWPAGWTGFEEHQLSPCLERQPVPYQSGQCQSHPERKGKRDEAHRCGSERDPDDGPC